MRLQPLLFAITLAMATVMVYAQTATALETNFCWKSSYGRGVGTIPGQCGPGQERNGLLCYDKCPAGYVSNGVDECIQKCPSGARDDGLFCAFPSYKATEYWGITADAAKKKCQASAAGRKYGCWHSTLLVYAVRCTKGYTNVAGFCTRKSIDCKGMGFMPGRVVNSCAKRVIIRAPKTSRCGSGYQYDAGLCYKSCGANSSGVGPVCWDACPTGWVSCAAGCAKSKAECAKSTTEQVKSVLDFAASTALLVASAGASAEEGPLLEKIGEEIPEHFATDVATKLPSKLSGPGKEAVQNTVELAKHWDEIKKDPSLSQKEKNVQIAKTAMKYASLVDPTGLVDMADAYTHVTCNDVAEGHSGSEGGASSTVVAMASIKAQKNLAVPAAASVSSLQGQMATLQAENAKRPSNALTKKIAETKNSLALAQQRLQAIQGLSNKLARTKIASRGSGPSAPPSAAKPTTPVQNAARAVSWLQVSGAAYDIAVADNGTVWVIGTNKGNGGYGIYETGPNQVRWKVVPGAAVRIAVQGDMPWVVNSVGKIYRWLGHNRWLQVPGPKAVDIGAGPKGGVWLIAGPKQGANYSIYELQGKRWVKTSGAAVRVDVDAAGNAWVVNSAGTLYANVKGQWHRFQTKQPAADLSVNTFGDPWVVGKSGALWQFDGHAKKWEEVKSSGAQSVAVAKTVWWVGIHQKIFRSK